MSEATLRREAHMTFTNPSDPTSGLLLDVFVTHDGHRIEAQTYTGKDYENRTFVSVTTQVGCPVACTFCEVRTAPFKRNRWPPEWACAPKTPLF